MSRSLLRILKIGGILFVLGSVTLTIFISVLLYQMPVEILGRKDLTQVNTEVANESPVLLEEGALVDGENLKKYLLFSRLNDDVEDWFSKQQVAGKIEKVDRNLYLIKRSIEIEHLHYNSCSELYCYQHRIGFDSIPSIFWKGLIGIEDYRFIKHFGIDLKAIARALVTDITQMSFVQGGSTLTQQLVKNLFLSSDKTLARKIKEIVYSVYIELRFEKDEILEAYFNEVYWGVLEGVRIKGLYAASALYFGVRPDEMTPFQATILIAMLKGPGYYSPIKHLERLRNRVEVVYKKLVELYLFPPDKTLVWNDKDWQVWQKDLGRKHKKRLGRSLWRSLNEEGSEFDALERFTLISAAEQILKGLKDWTQQDISAKVFLGIPHKPDVKPYMFYSKFERDRQRALTEEKHQVGSTLKPIIYSIFLNHGKKTDDLVKTTPIVLNLKSGKWGPREAHKMEQEEVTLLEALQHSYNRPVIHLTQEVGFDVVENELEDYIENLLMPLSEYPAQLLGAVELSVADLYGVYSKFIETQCTRNKRENLLFELGNPEETTVRKVVNDQLSQMRFFGKTGTSNNGYDNWFVFYDGYMLGVVWVGLEGSRENVKLNLYGSTTAFQIFQKFTRDRGKRFNELTCDGF